jgi:oligopeptide transport system substrate-binding protein
MKKLTAIAILMALFVGMVAGCKAKPGTSSSINTTTPITACIGAEPLSIDPAINQAVDGATYLVHAFEGLTKTDKDLQTVAGVAKSWTKSTNGLVFTFTLRDDAKWSDGKAVVASDFVYAWQRVVNPVTAAEYAYQLNYVKNAAEINAQFVGADGNPAKARVDGKGEFVKDDKKSYIEDATGKYVSAKADGTAIWLDDLGIVAVDAKTLKVTLAGPCDYFLQITAFPTLFPVRKDIIVAHPTDWATKPATYIGNGPYVLSKWDHNSKMVFTKNKDYYDSANIVANEIDFLLMTEDNSKLAAYKTGELLLSDGIPAAEIPALNKSGDAKIFGTLGTYYYVINVSKKPFDNVKVRMALNLAIDRQYICEKVSKGGQIPAGAFVPIDIPDATAGKDFRTTGKNYWDPTTTGYEANVVKAKQLLSDAGYHDGKNFPAVELKYNTESSTHKLIAEQIVSDWKKNLGITTITLASEEFKVLIADRNIGNYQVARDGWNGDYVDPMTFLDLFTTTSGNNSTKWSNTQYDTLITDAKKNSDPAKRMTDMHQAEDILMAQVPIMPIYYYTDPVLVSKKLVGFVNSPLGYKYLMWAHVA